MSLGGDRRLPAYLVQGDDSVLVAETVRGLVRELVGEEDQSLMVEDLAGDQVEMAAIVDAAQTPPFLTERRVVVARDVGRFLAEDWPVLLEYLETPLESTSLVLAGGGGRVPARVVTALKKVGHVVEAGVPSGKRGRGAWLDEHLKGAPVALDPAARSQLDRHLGEDLGRLTNLLEALAAAYGHGARIAPDDLEPFLGEAGSVPPWELTDAIDGGDTAAALSALRRMTAAGGRHPLQVLALLHGHYARLLRLDGAGVATEQQAADVLGMKGSTFRAKKSLEQVRRIGHDGVVAAFGHLHDADLTLKGEARDWPDELVMEVLVARLCHLAPRPRRGRARRSA